MATKVTMYEAKDGTLHKTPAACDAKNVELRLAPAIEKFVNSLDGSTVGLTNRSHGGTGSEGFYIDLTDLPAFLTAQSDALRKVLNDALVVKKPRKAKAEKPATSSSASPTTTQKQTPAEERESASNVEGFAPGSDAADAANDTTLDNLLAAVA